MEPLARCSATCDRASIRGGKISDEFNHLARFAHYQARPISSLSKR